MSTIPATGAQRQYVDDLCRKLRISTPALDAYCRERFQKVSADLSKQECSELLDAMTNWDHAPAELLRAMGQMDLFEVAG